MNRWLDAMCTAYHHFKVKNKHAGEEETVIIMDPILNVIKHTLKFTDNVNFMILSTLLSEQAKSNTDITSDHELYNRMVMLKKK